MKKILTILTMAFLCNINAQIGNQRIIGANINLGSGNHNTASGYEALQNMDKGNNNTAFGSNALRGNTGSSNFYRYWA